MNSDRIKDSTYTSAVVTLLMDFFGDSPSKVIAWMETDNYLLGYMSPIGMIKSGNGAKLIKYVGTMLDENVREENNE